MSLLQYLLFLLENDISDYIERNYLLGMDLSMNPFIVNTPEYNKYGLYQIIIGFYEDINYSYLDGLEVCYSVLIILNTDISFLKSNNVFYKDFMSGIKNNTRFSSCNFILNVIENDNLLDIHELDLSEVSTFSSILLPSLNNIEIYSAESFLSLKNNQIYNDIYLMKTLKSCTNSLKIDVIASIPRFKNCILYMDTLNILYEMACVYISFLLDTNKIVCKNLYLNKFSNNNQNVNLFLQSIINHIGISFIVEKVYLNNVLPLTISDIEKLCEYLKVIQEKSSCKLYINEKYAEAKFNIFTYLDDNEIYYSKLSREDIRGLYAKKV